MHILLFQNGGSAFKKKRAFCIFLNQILNELLIVDDSILNVCCYCWNPPKIAAFIYSYSIFICVMMILQVFTHWPSGAHQEAPSNSNSRESTAVCKGK